MTDDRTVIAGKSSVIGIGTELNQTYKIDALIGVGGMGEVFKGHNIQTGDPVAIKIVLPEFARDEMILELFRKEARILNHLSHDAIVRYYVFSIDQAIGRPYLAMEFVDGFSLAERVKTQPLSEGDFTLLLKRLADGLHKAHEAGVIHRDMSPDNVILPHGLVNNAKIIDFGIAKSANVGGATLLGGSFAGKYNYVSPEQLGLYGGEVTPKSDIYSLALVMAAAIRGRPLDMSGSQVEVIEKRRKVPDLADIPKPLRGVLAAMLQPDPAKRPANMADVRDWNEKNFNGTSKAKKTTGQAEGRKESAKSVQRTVASLTPQSNRLRNVAVAAGLLAIIGIGALGGWIFVKNAAPPLSTNTIGQPQTAVTDETPTTIKDGAETPVLLPQANNIPPANSQQDDLPKKIETPPEPAPVPRSISQPPPEKQTQPQATQDTKPAKLPAAQTSPKTTGVASLGKLINGFTTSNCFLADVKSLSETTANISVIATEDAAASFRQKFTQSAGYSPSITFHPLLDDQCGVISAIASVKPSSSPISIVLNRDQIRADNLVKQIPGEPISFDITGIGDRNIYIFMIDHTGAVTNITRARPDLLTMKPGQLTGKLNAGWPDEQDPGSKKNFLPMMILAIASPKPLFAINAQVMFDQQTFISDALPEVAATTDVSIATGYFKLMPP